MKNKSFAIFILSHGRPHDIITLSALKKANCTAKTYIIIDNEDTTASEYIKLYGDRVIQFDKTEYAKSVDTAAEHLETNNIPYGINTNFNVFKAIKPNYLKISLDGYNRESYLKARGVDKYDTVIRNIKEYLLYKHGTKAKTSVGLQTVVTSAEDVVKFYEAHKGLDVDYYSLRPVESTQGKYYKEKSEQEVNEVKQTLAELSALDKRICVNYKWNYLDRKFEKCHAAAFQICVNHKGGVSFCCHKPYEIVGHITDRDILQKKAAYKTDMNMCDIPCRLTGPCQCIYELEQDIVNPEFI